MDMDHEIALMYASNPFGFFQPQTRSYSPFGNVVLRVVRPRPRIEDLILGLLSPSDNDSLDIAATDSTGSQPEINSDTSNVPSDSTLEYDLSERMAREMQEQEDRDQQARDRAAALRQKFGDFVSSVFGSSDVGGVSSTFRRQPVNAEAGPSAIKPKPNHLYQAGSSSSNILNSPMAEQEVVDEANKSSGKERARPSPIFGLSSQSSSMDLLDSVEAALRHEVNKFDFPERLEFADNVNPLSGTLSSRALPTPALSRTSSNALVHMYEQAMLDLLANLDVVANDQDENVQMRRIHLVGKIRRELDDLDRKVLETWAARRRYTPARESV